MAEQPPVNTPITDAATRSEVVVSEPSPPMTPRAKLRQCLAQATATLLHNAVSHQQQTSSIAQAALTIGLQHVFGGDPIELEGEAS